MLLSHVCRDLPGMGQSPDLGRHSKPAQLPATARSGPAHPPARSGPAPEGPCPPRLSAAAPHAHSLLGAWCCWAQRPCRMECSLQLAAQTDKGKVSGICAVDSKRSHMHSQHYSFFQPTALLCIMQSFSAVEVLSEHSMMQLAMVDSRAVLPSVAPGDLCA